MSHQNLSFEIGYKVVVERLGGYFSSRVRGRDSVQYKLDGWSKAHHYKGKPDGYHLLYFNDLQKAIDFRNDINRNAIIFKCAIRNPIKLPRMKLIHLRSDEVAWRLDADRSWPDGICMAKEIMLLEKVMEINHE